MSQSREQPTDPGETRAARAEALLRSLTGILDARVETDAGGGIRRIALLAQHGLAARDAVRNAQSALLASLGLAIDSDRVAIDFGEPATSPPWRAHAAHVPAPRDPAAAAGFVTSVPTGRNGSAAPPQNGKAHAHGNGGAPTPETTLGSRGRGASVGAPRAPGPTHRTAELAESVDAAETEVAPAHTRPAPGLVRVDIEPAPPDRVRVRVVLAFEDRINVGEADGIDTPTARLELAARALLRAVPARHDRDLDGVRTLDIAGRTYIVVAVRSIRGRTVQYHADAIAADGPLEHAAALATLGAVIR